MNQQKKPYNYDKKISHAALGFGCNATYNTSNKDYGQGYLIDEKISQVPTYSEVVETLQDFKKMERLLKNRTVASQYSKEANQEGLDEIEREKFKLDRNVIVPKVFPVKAEQYQYPQPSLNPGNILYKTTNKDYGHKIPSDQEIPNKFFPRDTKYTTSFPDNYKFNGLNTAKTFSKVHKNLDEI